MREANEGRAFLFTGRADEGASPVALKAWHLVGLATALAFGLARYQLGHEPFWLDEFETWRWAHLPFAEIRPRAARGYHTPLYFWFMHGWVRLGPSPDEVWLRLPSAMFFALTVPMVYLVGRALGGTSRAGVYAAFLAATFPFLLHYGQEARSYAMVTFFAACGFAAAARIMCRCRDKARPRLPGAGLVDACGWLARGHWRESGLCRGRSCDPRTPGWQALGDDGAWMAYIVSSAVVMWLHNTAGLFPVVTGLILLCAIWASPSHRGVRFASLCIAMAAIAVLYSPQIPYLLSGVGRISLFYLQVPNAERAASMLARVYGGGYIRGVLLMILAMVAVAVSARRGRWDRVAFALIGWLLAPTVFIAFSFWKPIVQAQLMIWTLVPFFAACGAGLALVPWTLVRVAVPAALLAWNLHSVTREWSIVKQDWREVPRAIPQAMSPDATVLICPRWYMYIFNHYWEMQGREGVKLHFIDLLGGRQKIFEVAGPDDWGPEISLAQLSAQYPEIWSIRPHLCSADMNSVGRALEETGLEKGPLLKLRGVWLQRYARSE